MLQQRTHSISVSIVPPGGEGGGANLPLPKTYILSAAASPACPGDTKSVYFATTGIRFRGNIANFGRPSGSLCGFDTPTFGVVGTLWLGLTARGWVGLPVAGLDCPWLVRRGLAVAGLGCAGLAVAGLAVAGLAAPAWRAGPAGRPSWHNWQATGPWPPWLQGTQLQAQPKPRKA